MRRRIIGQGWYYPTERTIILWECFFDQQASRHDSTAEDEAHDVDDPNLRALWRGFERFLAGRFPDAERLVTTQDDPLYEPSAYRRMLSE